MNSIAVRIPSTFHARGIEIIIRKTQLLRINIGKISKISQVYAIFGLIRILVRDLLQNKLNICVWFVIQNKISVTIDLRRSQRRSYAFDHKKKCSSALRSPERSAFFVIKTAPVNGSRF